MGNPLTEGSLDERRAFVTDKPIDEVMSALADVDEESLRELAAFMLETEQSKGKDARKTFVAALEGILEEDDEETTANARVKITEDCKVMYNSQLLSLRKDDKLEGELAAYLLDTGAPAEEL